MSVSVVIPTYNCAPLLPCAIASARAQRWPELEIIVVDDGSTDDTQAVLKSLAGPDLRVLFGKNQGPAAARNLGIQNARGEWIAFLDADDEWLPGKLARQFEALDRNPEAAFSYTDVRIRYESGKEQDLACPSPEEPLLAGLLGGNRFATPSVMIRRRCFETVGLFNVLLRTGEDWDMWLRLAAHYDCCWVNEPLALIRVSSSPRRSVTLLEECTLRVLERLFCDDAAISRYPQLLGRRRQVYAWHCNVLAKSYLRHRQPAMALRMAVRAVLFGRLGLGCRKLYT